MTNTNIHIIWLTKKGNTITDIFVKKKAKNKYDYTPVDKKGTIQIQIRIFGLAFANTNTNTNSCHTLFWDRGILVFWGKVIGGLEDRGILGIWGLGY